MNDHFKKIVLNEAQKKPEKFFPVEALESEGFSRKKCQKCHKMFWSTTERDTCDEPLCSGGWNFVGKKICKENFDIVSGWKKFSKFMKKRGYTPIRRYPVAARWRDDTEFVQASIYDFQPHVVSGEVEPPANPLVVPQFCLRFNDIDNTGLTGRHYTGFIMIGQHAFEREENYQQEKYFLDMLRWLTEGMRLEKKNIVIHEDAWAGGGNLGACLEFFVLGLELFNQVYMFYDISGNKIKDLKLKVLDMGLGYERMVWLGSSYLSSYQANMPLVVKNLIKEKGLFLDEKSLADFIKLAGFIDLEKEQDLEMFGYEFKELYQRLKPLFNIFSIADHTRSLLVAINDGILPSNSGGGYNLRILARRALNMIKNLKLGLSLRDIVEMHAKELGKLYPELEENVEEVGKILDYEEKRHKKSLENARKIISKIKEEVGIEQLKFLYKSHGITPEILLEAGVKIQVPKNFYALISEQDGKKQGVEEGLKVDFPETELLYMKDNYMTEFRAKVIGKVKDYVVLDRTAFYPTSGGQLHDKGILEGKNGSFEVTEVKKVGKVVLHKVKGVDIGERVLGKIDKERRMRLMKHHTATHIINGSCRRILGEHIWQAGAEKNVEKGRIDVTHYKKIEKEELRSIERLANEVVEKGLKVEKIFMKRNEAEKKFGFRIYQGGYVPGNLLRIVRINGFDVEACGGTHVDNTREVGKIKIIGSKKIQDGVIRIEFSCGESAEGFLVKESEIIEKIKNLIPYEGKIDLERLSENFRVRKEELFDTIKRFLKDYREKKWKIEKLEDIIGEKGSFSSKYQEIKGEKIYDLFEIWKMQDKDIELLEKKIVEKTFAELAETKEDFILKRVDLSLKSLSELAKKIVRFNDKICVVLVSENCVVASKGEKSSFNADEEVRKLAKVVKGDKNFAFGFNLKN